MVELKNKTKRMLVFHLPGLAEQAGFKGYRDITYRYDLDKKSGVHGKRQVKIKCPPSITLLAGETFKNLPDIVKSAPEIMAAVKRGDVALVEVQEAKAPPQDLVPRKSRKKSR